MKKAAKVGPLADVDDPDRLGAWRGRSPSFRFAHRRNVVAALATGRIGLSAAFRGLRRPHAFTVLAGRRGNMVVVCPEASLMLRRNVSHRSGR